jgi:hypothetical protein
MATSSPVIYVAADQPIFENPYPESDPRYRELAPIFDVIEKARRLASQCVELPVRWRARFGQWKTLPASTELRTSQIVESSSELTSLGAEAARILLNSADTSAGELRNICLNAIREESLRAEDRAIVAGQDKDCFAREAAQCGYFRRGSPIAVCERVWLRMQATGEPLVVVERTIPNKFGPGEQPAEWLHDGSIEHPFNAITYLAGIHAARRVRELGTIPQDGGSAITVPRQETTDRSADPQQIGVPVAQVESDRRVTPASTQAQPASEGPPESKQEITPHSAVSQLARNIDSLRLEGGLSYRSLSKELGRNDHKAVAAHCTGKRRPQAYMLAIYARAFSRLLRRQIRPQDLSSNSVAL